jgi:hypothetical protein
VEREHMNNKCYYGIKQRLLLVLCVSASLLFCSCYGKTISSSQTSSTTQITSATTTAPNESRIPAISQEQAIAIAGHYFPVSVLLQSTITIRFAQDNANTIWQVGFDGFTTTRDVLLQFGWDSNSISDNYTAYHVATINVDALTGAIIDKLVTAIRLGGPVTISK